VVYQLVTRSEAQASVASDKIKGRFWKASSKTVSSIKLKRK